MIFAVRNEKDIKLEFRQNGFIERREVLEGKSGEIILKRMT